MPENKTLKKCYETIKQEKKKDYNSRILNVEQGLFTHLFIFSIVGRMEREGSIFFKILCQLIAAKQKESLRTEFGA